MSNMLSTRQAYTEIDSFLELLSEEQKNQVPYKLRELFKKEKAPNYKKVINPNIPIKDQNLKKETLVLIALLNLKYWCKDEEERQRLETIYKENEIKYQKETNDKNNYDFIFDKKKKSEPEVTNQIIVYKESMIKKIINKILNFFKK